MRIRDRGMCAGRFVDIVGGSIEGESMCTLWSSFSKSGNLAQIFFWLALVATTAATG